MSWNKTKKPQKKASTRWGKLFNTLFIIFGYNFYDMLDLVKNSKEALTVLCQKYGVKTMHIFGSAAVDQFNESSDIDILVSFKELSIEQYTDNYFNLHEELENLFSQKVDLITERSLSNPYFIEGVEKTKQLLYAA